MSEISSLISSGAARGAYRSSQALTAERTEPLSVPETDKGSFSEVLRQASSDALASVRQSDVTMQAGLKGEVDTQQVVEATIALESTVKVAVAMRDKFVEAYQEILRMPI